MTDISYMRFALELAKKGEGMTSPNPLVGAVIVKNGKIIGQGYHERYGELHAERNALKNCTESPEGATMYVTLEPCCHTGKQPPCTEAILENKIARVVVGSLDPNPLVAGKGIEILRENGVWVQTEILKEECDAVNEVFMKFIKTKRPFVAMKYAMTADGKIAAYTGKSKWITNDAARAEVHRLRHRYSGIMVGVGTVLADDPMLNCRIENGKDPVRIICDTNLRTPLDSNIVKTAKEIKTIIACAECDNQKALPFIEAGCEMVFVPKNDTGSIDLNRLMDILGERKIDSILLEGGAELNYSALNAKIVDKVFCYIAPKLFGGKTAKTPIGGLGVESPDECFKIENAACRMIGEDFCIEGSVSYVHRDS
ncbi:MAG: bifunctional diaminohydroxyphosphoribosylaminopyrimidine deaminase/5-amino-6-(5-phosphoribosylamino)uracil reductase RibD [Oscillospiraceae bacterium]|nr:bifunctional diaminohydroxyphosphoribosylaminopyrimidine deaminase/5-amino-6-(5-phosphoribosylamino)uracil reductase RibD [Oscillospiraceae bacterium]